MRIMRNREHPHLTAEIDGDASTITNCCANCGAREPNTATRIPVTSSGIDSFVDRHKNCKMTFNAKHLMRLLTAFAEATVDAEFGPAPEHREAIRQYLRQTLVPGWKESRRHIFDVLDDDVFTGMLTEYAERSWRGYRDAAAHMADKIIWYAKKGLK